MIRQPEREQLNPGPSRSPIRSSSLLDIIQQKPSQVNHVYNAQSKKQKRKAFFRPPASLLDPLPAPRM